MAIYLAERGVDAVAALLLSQLGIELTAIDTERDDGITLAAPVAANYYKRPKPVIEGGTVHVEVYEGSIEFLGSSRTFGTNIGDARALYELPVTVRLTYFNRDGDTRDTMIVRMRRYAAGLFNSLAKNSDLSDSDDATKGVSVQSMTPPWEELDDSVPGVFKGRITMQSTVRCEEVQT